MSAHPKVLEPSWSQLGVAHGRLNASMAQVSLQRAGIGPLVCQRVAAGVAQHVGMKYLGLNASPLDQLGQAGDRERRTTF